MFVWLSVGAAYATAAKPRKPRKAAIFIELFKMDILFILLILIQSKAVCYSHTMHRLQSKYACAAAMAAAFLVCIPAGAEAHSTAVYAGLYIIDMQAMPLAPLVGDPMHFNFQVYDLRYVHYAKPLKANLEITDPTTGGAIFITSSTLLTDGKFSADFTFPRQGIFNVTLNTWKPDEPNVIRDATFAIQVR